MPQRKPNRLPEYDYSEPGYYFVTICMKSRRPAEGGEETGKSVLNRQDHWAQHCWKAIPAYYRNVALDEFRVLADHIHGIIILLPADEISRADERPAGNVSNIVKSYKSAVIKGLRREDPGTNFEWQKSFHDRVIRSERELEEIRHYIRFNEEKHAAG
jgi:REP element-mobilizing transposase RayT